MKEQPVLTVTAPSQTLSETWADWAGMFASISCAIHCAAMPLVLAYLPALGLEWMNESGFHRWMTLICFTLALVAFLPGWQKHRSLAPATWGTVGILLLALGAFGMEGYCCQARADSIANPALAKTNYELFCTICTAGGEAGSQANALTALLMPIAHYITPLGGLFLVVGHITNHRKACSCDCGTCSG